MYKRQDVDLAHIYYKEGDDFVNLGVASGCISENEHNIKAKLDDLPDIHYLKAVSYTHLVVLYFWQTVKNMLVQLWEHKFLPDFKVEGVRLAYFLLFATVPAIVIGGMLKYLSLIHIWTGPIRNMWQ